MKSRCMDGAIAVDNLDFFWEWRSNLPDLTAAECAVLDRLRARYRHYQTSGVVSQLGREISFTGSLKF